MYKMLKSKAEVKIHFLKNIISSIVSNWDKILTEQAVPFIDYNTFNFLSVTKCYFDKEFVDAISVSPCGEVLLGD